MDQIPDLVAAAIAGMCTLHTGQRLWRRRQHLNSANRKQTQRLNVLRRAVHLVLADPEHRSLKIEALFWWGTIQLFAADYFLIECMVEEGLLEKRGSLPWYMATKEGRDLVLAEL